MVNFYVWTRAPFAAFGGFMFGYDLGSINGVKDMDGFRDFFDISMRSNGNDSSSDSCDDDVDASVILGLIVSALSYGSLIGALLAGTLADFVGRKIAIIIGASIFTLGCVVQTGAYFLWMIFLGRAVAGFGVGVLFMVVPVYIAELSPKRLRGRLVSFTALALSGGTLTAFVVNVITRRFDFGWRISLGLQCVSGSILTIGMLFLPESPRWLVRKGKVEKAKKIVTRVHPTNEKKVEDEIQEMEEQVRQMEGRKFWDTLKEFFHWRVLKRIGIGIVLQLFNRFVGIPVFSYYSVTILCKIGVPAYEVSVGAGVVYFLTTFLAIFFVDKLGRKALLLLGSLGMMLAMVTGATLLLVFEVEEGGHKEVAYVVVVLFILFVFSYAYTFGAVTWVINSEIHPLRVRGIAVSLTTSAFWIANIVMAQVTPILLSSKIQTFGTFYILAGVHLIAFLFVLLTLPETKGKSLEGLEILFSLPWLERIKLPYYLGCGYPWKWCRRKLGYWTQTEEEEAEVCDEELELEEVHSGFQAD